MVKFTRISNYIINLLISQKIHFRENWMQLEQFGIPIEFVQAKTKMYHMDDLLLCSQCQKYFTQRISWRLLTREMLIFACQSVCFRGRSTCDPEMFELLLIYMTENNLSPPTTAREGLKLYEKLRTSVLNDLHPNM